MKRLLVLVLFFASGVAAQQGLTNSFNVAQFPGGSVAAKITNAQAACLPDTNITCVLLLDPQLSSMPVGNMPSRCANCVWLDYRGGNFTASPFATAISNLNNIRVIDGQRYPFSMAGIQSAITDLGGSGSVILPCATYQGTATITTPSNTFITLQGSGQDCTIIQLTTTASLLHGIVAKGGLLVRDLTVNTQTPPASNLGMTAIRFSTPDTGSPPNPVNVFVQRVKVRGFNEGIFTDGRGSGLTNTDLNQVLIIGNDVAIAGCPTGVPCECVFTGGASLVLEESNRLNNNSIGDHASYNIQDLNLTIRGNDFQNANAATGVFGVKIQNQNGAAEYLKWQVTGNTFTNVQGMVLANPKSTDEIDLLNISDNEARTITDTTATDFALNVTVSGTAIIDSVVVQGNKIENIQLGALIFNIASGARVKHAYIGPNFVRDFSKSSSGTNAAVTQSSTGITDDMVISGLRVDGNSTGRSAFDFTGATITRLNVIDFSQSNTTNAVVPTPAIQAPTNALISSTAPTISAGFGTSPSIATNNGTASFTVNVGTGGTANSGTIGLPAAVNGWNCDCEDITTFSSTVFRCRQTGPGTTTAVPIGNFTSAAAAGAWVASDTLNVKCMSR